MLLNANRRLGAGFELAHVDPLLPAGTKVQAACHRAVIEAKSCGRKGGAVGAACTRADQSRQGPISPTSPILRKRTAPSTHATSHIGAGRAHSPMTNRGSWFAFTKARSSAVGPGTTVSERCGKRTTARVQAGGAGSDWRDGKPRLAAMTG